MIFCLQPRRLCPRLTASKERKNAALEAIAKCLTEEQDLILAANRRLDIEAFPAVSTGEVMIDRLTLTPDRIAGMAQGCA